MQEVFLEDDSSMPISFVIDTNVVMLCFFMQMLDTGCSIAWVHVVRFLQVLR